MSQRPNKKALTDALDIYRDAMRPFITWYLKRVRGRKIEDCISSALREDHYRQFMQSIEEGKSIEEAIDIGHFPRIVKEYWWDVFRNAFRPDSEVRESLTGIARARNRVAHPDSGDVDIEFTADTLGRIVEVLSEINRPEQSQAVAQIRAMLLPFRLPAHRFRQGGRNVYAFTLDLETLNRLLPDRVDDKVVKDANRPLTQSHARSIQDYLREREDWLLGTLLLGVAKDELHFEPYGSNSDMEESVGTLTIGTDSAARMKMFDGQHRRRAIKDLLQELSDAKRYARKLNSLRQTSLPIMLYEEDSIEALRQMFADAAHTRPIERNTVAQFDQRDAFNLAAMSIAEESDLFAGRVEMNRSSVARSNHNIIAINQLAATLKTLEVGYSGRVSKDRNVGYMLDLDSLHERCLTWADDFMPAARDEYNDLMAGEIDNTEIPDMRVESMAFNATVIRILAGCYYVWTSGSEDWEQLANFLRNACLKPKGEAGTLLVDAGVVPPGGTSPAARQSLVVNAIEYIVTCAREASMRHA